MFKDIQKYSFKSTPMETPVATPNTMPRKDSGKVQDKFGNFVLWEFIIISIYYNYFWELFIIYFKNLKFFIIN